MFSARKTVFVIFTVMMVSIILICCHSNILSKKSYHDFLQTAEFKKMKRIDQVAKCALCHKQECENEMKGPHANAYQHLAAHQAFVNSDRYNCDFYTKQVNTSIEHCMGCHTPQNIFETLLRDTIGDPFKFATELLKEAHPRPFVREDIGSRNGSIDCMSCHADGNDMRSLSHTFTASDSIVRLQTVPVLVATNITCYLCHADVVRNLDAGIAIKKTGQALCVNCHQEYDAKGKGTHYYFWQHDSKEKVNPKIEKVMNDFHFSVSPDKKQGIITWQNTIMPHKISPGPEMILNCEVLDKDSNILGLKTIRINKKQQFDKELYAGLGNHNLLGVEGNDVPLDGKSIQYFFPMKRADRASTFRISFVHKSQYWFPDSLGVITAVKTYAVSK
jgi:hypothetical protein